MKIYLHTRISRELHLIWIHLLLLVLVKTFRTGWKRHTLNPVFKERLAFEILPHESNFSIQFLVLDKDHFSFHDDVAHISLPLRDITEYATVRPVEENNLDITDGPDLVREKHLLVSPLQNTKLQVTHR